MPSRRIGRKPGSPPFHGISVASILDAVGSAVICISPQYRILEWNAAAARAYGRSRKEVLGESYLELFIPEPSRERFTALVERVVAGTAVRPFEAPVRGGNGLERILLWHVARLLDSAGRPIGVVASGQDITPRKRVNEYLKVSRAQLRDLTHHLNKVREDERARVARQVHDDLGQSLAALVMGLSQLESETPENWDPRRSETVRELRNLAEATSEAAHTISTALRPAILDDLGLEAAIEWEARRFADQSGIQCTRRLQRGILDPDTARRTAVFRIFKELLTNVSRHSGASRVSVGLTHAQESLVLEVKDNGRGIKTGELDARRSLGILGMRERASFWGGDITFRGVPGQGTTATLRLPLPPVKVRARRKRTRGVAS